LYKLCLGRNFAFYKIDFLVYHMEDYQKLVFLPHAHLEMLLGLGGRAFGPRMKAFIPFDPLLAQHILPPYSIYLQPWGSIQVSVTQITPEGFFVEAEKAPPLRVSCLLQARSSYANERLSEVNPHRYFTPFQPVTTYLTLQD
jgi:hypothetical protein